MRSEAWSPWPPPKPEWEDKFKRHVFGASSAPVSCLSLALLLSFSELVGAVWGGPVCRRAWGVDLADLLPRYLQAMI